MALSKEEEIAQLEQLADRREYILNNSLHLDQMPLYNERLLRQQVSDYRKRIEKLKSE